MSLRIRTKLLQVTLFDIILLCPCGKREYSLIDSKHDAFRICRRPHVGKVYNQNTSLLIVVLLSLAPKIQSWKFLLLTCYLAQFTHGYSMKFGNQLGKTRQHNIFPCKIWTPQYLSACWTENCIAVNSTHSWGGETHLSDREQQGLAAPQRSVSQELRGALQGLCHHQLATLASPALLCFQQALPCALTHLWCTQTGQTKNQGQHPKSGYSQELK